MKPKIIGAWAVSAPWRLIKEDFKITQEHGQFFEKNGIQMMALYHPAALLRDPRKAGDLEDLKRLQAKIQEICDHIGAIPNKER